MPAPLAFLALFTAADADRTLTVASSRSLPPVEAVVIYPDVDVKPGTARPKPVLTAKPDTAIKLPATGPYAVFVRPKGGIEVLAADGITVTAGELHTLKLGDLFAVVEVFQGDLPRADRIVLTAPLDPGPDEKGHVPVQTAADFRTEMVVPEGFYAVWIVPANGARAQRIEDRIRVLPGRHLRINN